MSSVSPSGTKAILQKHSIRLTKKLGQHFLIDANIVAKEVKAAALTKSDTVLEIGPGIGTLTRALAEAAGRVVAVELDSRLIPVIREATDGLTNLTVIQGDALKLDLDTLGATKLVANLPYNIATPLIVKVLTEAPRIAELTCLVQKEIAERLTAPAGSDDYGPLAVTVEAYAAAGIVFAVSPRSFMPPPKVFSAAVSLRRRAEPQYGEETPAFLSFCRELFTLRRKTVKNALATRWPALASAEAETIVAEAGIDRAERIEKLDTDEIFRIFIAQKRYLS